MTPFIQVHKITVLRIAIIIMIFGAITDSKKKIAAMYFSNACRSKVKLKVKYKNGDDDDDDDMMVGYGAVVEFL